MTPDASDCAMLRPGCPPPSPKKRRKIGSSKKTDWRRVVDARGEDVDDGGLRLFHHRREERRASARDCGMTRSCGAGVVCARPFLSRRAARRSRRSSRSTRRRSQNAGRVASELHGEGVGSVRPRRGSGVQAPRGLAGGRRARAAGDGITCSRARPWAWCRRARRCAPICRGDHADNRAWRGGPCRGGPA